ncbi:MAG: MerR family DNA-binding protein [Chloroflexi bacterium]|nr:MerR family DNA-binding protein [Chloroflexota bacterium]
MMGLRTGQLAKRAGVNLETVRFYERKGLLPVPPRSESGYRSFSLDDVRRIQFIKRAQELGFTLDEIRELLALRVQPGANCGDVRRRAEAKMGDIDQKIRALRAIRRALMRLASSCKGRGPVGECLILDALEGKSSQ